MSATYGIRDGEFSIGNTGVIRGLASSVNESKSVNINSDQSSIDDYTAYSRVGADTAGIVNGLDPAYTDITIGSVGRVEGQASLTLQVISQSTTGTGSTKADADARGYGINLQSSSSDVRIGDRGSILGEATIGSSSRGPVHSPLLVLATSVSDLVDASVNHLSAYGIFGTIGTGGDPAFSTLQAGPTAGAITGTSETSTQLESTNIGISSATSSTTLAGTGLNPLNSVGISAADMVAGQDGKGLITGSSTNTLQASSTSVYGDSQAETSFRSMGISYWSGHGSKSSSPAIASISGNMNALSSLSSSLLATSIHGNATTTTSNESFGLWGYNVIMPDSGSLNTSAYSRSNSLSSSIFGSSSA